MVSDIEFAAEALCGEEASRDPPPPAAVATVPPEADEAVGAQAAEVIPKSATALPIIVCFSPAFPALLFKSLPNDSSLSAASSEFGVRAGRRLSEALLLPAAEEA